MNEKEKRELLIQDKEVLLELDHPSGSDHIDLRYLLRSDHLEKEGSPGLDQKLSCLELMDTYK